MDSSLVSSTTLLFWKKEQVYFRALCQPVYFRAQNQLMLELSSEFHYSAQQMTGAPLRETNFELLIRGVPTTTYSVLCAKTRFTSTVLPVPVTRAAQHVVCAPLRSIKKQHKNNKQCRQREN